MFSQIRLVKDRKIIGEVISISGLIDLIKDKNRVEFDSIQYLRDLFSKKEKFKSIIGNLPAITFNFNFENNYVSSYNATISTGYLYYELPALTEMDIDISYITAFWRTIKNDGYGILVKAEGVTKENFSQYYKAVGEVLGLDYDKYFGYISKIVVVSYDSDAHYNESALFFEKKDFEDKINSIPQYGHDTLLCNHTGGEISFSNLKNVLSEAKINFDTDGVHDFGSDKLNYCECYVPRKFVSNGNESKNLLGFSRCVISINSSITYLHFKHLIEHYNNKYIFPALSVEVVDKIISSTYALRGQIKPINNKTKRYHFDEKIFKTTKQKQQYSALKTNERQIENTINILADCIRNWDYIKYPKVTQKNLQIVSGKNIKTVEKHYRKVLEIAGLSKSSKGSIF